MKRMKKKRDNMELYIDNRQDIVEVEDGLDELLEKVVLECLKVEGLNENYEVSISFVDNKEIRQLNKDYRGKDKETDVLSFPIDEDMDIPLPLLGDIIISLEKAREQAQEFQHSLIREISYLTVHSMFHLMGYDHMEDGEKTIMREKEKKVMENLNIFRI